MCCSNKIIHTVTVISGKGTMVNTTMSTLVAAWAPCLLVDCGWTGGITPWGASRTSTLNTSPEQISIQLYQKFIKINKHISISLAIYFKINRRSWNKPTANNSASCDKRQAVTIRHLTENHSLTHYVLRFTQRISSYGKIMKLAPTFLIGSFISTGDSHVIIGDYFYLHNLWPVCR